MDAYFFREGYLRLSSTAFDLNDTTNVGNQFMHLTNYAVQKFSHNYGQFEDGNQMTFADFQ